MRPTLRMVVALIAISAGAAACSGGQSGSVGLKTPGTVHAVAATPAGDPATASTSPGTGPATTAPASKGSTTTVRPAGTPGAPTSTAAPGTTALPRSNPPTTTGPVPVTPGTYQYNLLSGTSTYTSGSTATTLPVATSNPLTVSAQGNGAEQWSYPSASTTVVFNSAGVFLTAETVTALGVTCAFTNPVATPPWPVAVGRSFGGNANCADSKGPVGTLTLSGHVAAPAPVPPGVPLAGVPTVTIVSTQTLGTMLAISETDWYAPSLRLPIASSTVTYGALGGGTFQTTATYALASSRPS